jgi:hypothetical protein
MTGQIKIQKKVEQQLREHFIWSYYYKDLTLRHYFKPGGLNLSRSCLDRDSQSQHWQRAGLNSRENLNTFKKLVSTIKISRSRLRNLNFVCTPSSSPKSLNRDREICQDMTFLANLDSLSQSRVSKFYHISWSRFLNFSRF